jgi:hypothetical protein
MESFDQIDAAHARHHQVGQHHVHALLATDLQTDARVCCE